ncbi:Cytochrome b-c1 complex subunit 7 [Frankliniella fusca]|uniref:Cytochrome b-c1 complex subunit 7 n=2 Tax=Arthropoda TaxID=6656 RepID=A0AAE1LNC2_9NEOP|nr:Cytochrome b-c1 complex subunit 7 [Frankliniella fusca]
MRIIRALFSAAKAAQTTEISSWDKFFWNANGYNKLGLLSDDLYTELDDTVVEALKRIPEEVKNQRIFRHNRAALLSMNKTILPEDQWTKIEEDTPYLTPHIEQIEKEMEEKRTWEDKNPL